MCEDQRAGSGCWIVKMVSNSGDWNCTYHYPSTWLGAVSLSNGYHDGQRTIELRDASDDVLKASIHLTLPGPVED